MHVKMFFDQDQHHSGGCNNFDPDNVLKLKFTFFKHDNPFIGISKFNWIC